MLELEDRVREVEVKALALDILGKDTRRTGQCQR